MLAILTQTFVYPADFDPDERLLAGFGLLEGKSEAITVRFSPHVANYLRERTWAKEQSLTEQEDGSLILRMKTAVNTELYIWLMSFGSNAEVLEPEHVRHNMVDDARKILALYGGSQAGAETKEF
jgi:predicted DNA-binding transcriptional regulator YafY